MVLVIPRPALFAFLLASLFCIQTVECAGYSDKIKHIVVLMMENRSFDHLLGMLKKVNPEINGCLEGQEGCSNPVDPANPTTSSPIYVNDQAVYEQADPHHSVSGTSQQIFGVVDDGNMVPSMDGFIASYSDEFPDGDGSSIMKCFAPEHVPAISTLATEFAVFDGYFASVPGPTEPNRAFAISASSDGMCTNDAELMVRGMPQKTIFRQIEEMGHDWNIYMDQVPAALMFKDLRHRDARPRYHFLKQFYEDASTGSLPEYSWLEPSYFDVPLTGVYAADQHPAHDVSVGDQLIKDVYEALRASPQWNETALIVTYDEHGGFFDHVPPEGMIPNPDGKTCDEFDFTRQGVRVPFIVASPWVAKGTVVHGAPAGAGQYEHSSLAATVVHKLLKPRADKNGHQPAYLTERDAWAATFEGVFDSGGLIEPRTDCPVTLPEVLSHRAHFPAGLASNNTGLAPLSTFQRSLVMMMAGVMGNTAVTEHLDILSSWTEAQAGAYVVAQMEKFLKE